MPGPVALYKMAEKRPDVVHFADDDNGMMAGPVNLRQTKDYMKGIDGIIEDFQKLLDEDWMDVLEVTIKNLKSHMCSQFDSMQVANISIIIGCLKDPKCVYLWQSLQEDTVKNINPKEETPSGSEVIQKLPLKKQYSGTVKYHIINLFNYILNAQSEASLPAANISALVKITDEETLDIVL